MGILNKHKQKHKLAPTVSFPIVTTTNNISLLQWMTCGCEEVKMTQDLWSPLSPSKVENISHGALGKAEWHESLLKKTVFFFRK